MDSVEIVEGIVEAVHTPDENYNSDIVLPLNEQKQDASPPDTTNVEAQDNNTDDTAPLPLTTNEEAPDDIHDEVPTTEDANPDDEDTDDADEDIDDRHMGSYEIVDGIIIEDGVQQIDIKSGMWV